MVAATAMIHALQHAFPAVAATTAAAAAAAALGAAGSAASSVATPAAASAASSVATSAAASALSAVSATAVLRQGWFVVLVVAGCVDKLMGLASGVAFENDWVLVLVGPNRPVPLATANAMLRRVEQSCEVAAALIFGWLIAAWGPLVCAKACLALVALSLPAMVRACQPPPAHMPT
ncbi:unnamed protein product [Closterium sp. NIES-64]|nr:unnamed protein product [Closterium sp. NIES-64]